jgi:hypothetical protein
MTAQVSRSTIEIETTTQRIQKLSLGNHRNSTPIPRIQTSTPIAIPQRRASRRSFELIKSPTPRSRSSTLPGSSPSGSSPEKTRAIFDDQAFLKEVESYGKGNTQIDPILKLIRKYPFDISALMMDEGNEVMKLLGTKQVECITKLLSIDAKTFPKSVPLRENTACTSFYREFCNYHFAQKLKECAKKGKKELSQIIDHIVKKMQKQDLTTLRVIHNVMREYIPSGQMTNFKAFVVVTFINRIVSPIFTIKSGESPKESDAEQFKTIAKQLQKGASKFLAGSSLSNTEEKLSGEEIRAFNTLADLLYTGK